MVDFPWTGGRGFGNATKLRDFCFGLPVLEGQRPFPWEQSGRGFDDVITRVHVHFL